MGPAIETSVARILGPLREAALNANPRANEHIAPGLYFSWEESETAPEVTLASAPGEMFDLSAVVHGNETWFTFNIEIGPGSFEIGDILGLVVDLEGFEGESVSIAIRTAKEGEVTDTLLQDTLRGSGERCVRTVLNTVTDKQQALLDSGGFHTLVFHLPKQAFTCRIHDMRFFMIGAEEGRRSVPLTLSGLAR